MRGSADGQRKGEAARAGGRKKGNVPGLASQIRGVPGRIRPAGGASVASNENHGLYGVEHPEILDRKENAVE